MSSLGRLGCKGAAMRKPEADHGKWMHLSRGYMIFSFFIMHAYIHCYIHTMCIHTPCISCVVYHVYK